MKRLLSALLVAAALPLMAQEQDLGLDLTLGGDIKIDRRWSIGVEGEMLSRNDCKTIERWRLGAEASFRATRWLKLTAGYQLQYNNYQEKIKYESSGELKNWRPSYWKEAHRLYASATLSASCGRFDFSLRERWQYTLRPESTQRRYDFGDKAWEDHLIETRHKHILRSRVKVGYDIPKCKIDPYASVELFNGWELDKTRYIVGVEWKIRKVHTVDVFYRYDNMGKQDPLENTDNDMHIVGLGYTYKF